MKKPASPKPRRPNVVKVDRVKDLAAGLRRGLSESGWSERGLALAAGLKADRLRNVGRGLSSTLPAAVLDRVADTLAVPPRSTHRCGGLACRWGPAEAIAAIRGKRRPPCRCRAAWRSWRLRARRVAVEARAAVHVAIASAQAAERVAAWAEAAAAAPQESAESAFERWTADVQAEHAVQHRATKILPPGSPNPNPSPPEASSPRYQPPTKAEIAADPARFMPVDNGPESHRLTCSTRLSGGCLAAHHYCDRQLKLVFISRPIAGNRRHASLWKLSARTRSTSTTLSSMSTWATTTMPR